MDLLGPEDDILYFTEYITTYARCQCMRAEENRSAKLYKGVTKILHSMFTSDT